MNPHPRAARRPGVTLLELAIVLLIMGLLAVGAMGYYQGSREYANRSKALEDMSTIRNAIHLFRAEPFNTERRRPLYARELVTVFFSGTQTVLVQSGDARVPEEQWVTVKRHYLDGLRKTPWGLDYNIDLYNVVAWNTDRRDEKRGPVWGSRLLLPYSNVNTEGFEASPSNDAWEFTATGEGGWAWTTGALELWSTHANSSADSIFLAMKKDIAMKGTEPELPADPNVALDVNLMDVKWGSVVTVTFDYEQSRTTSEGSLDDDAVDEASTLRYEQTIVERAIDFDPMVSEKEKVGAILLWPKSKPPQTLGAPTDGDAAVPVGVRFSDREWEIVPNARVIVPALPPPGSTGQWGEAERHEVRFISKYDELKDIYLIDVVIDGDNKESIVFPPGGDRSYRLTVSPDHYTDPSRTVSSRMVVRSVSVSGYDFSKHYQTPLWPDVTTYGRK